MVDRDLLNKKKALQKTKNLLSEIGWIKILDYEEQNIFRHDRKTMHEFGLDSRDEYRISYDSYCVNGLTG